MQQRPKATPAKPPRLKANLSEVATRKQLQFVSPLPRRSRVPQAATTIVKKKTMLLTTTTTTTATRKKKLAKETPTDSSSIRDVAATANVTSATATGAAIKTRLAVGCSSLMYACQHGDIVQVLAQIRAKFKTCAFGSIIDIDAKFDVKLSGIEHCPFELHTLVLLRE
ncbi:hypothetical protein ACLKA6_014417 [Drosophila palustris]